jgi:hypothetical protein
VCVCGGVCGCVLSKCVASVFHVCFKVVSSVCQVCSKRVPSVFQVCVQARFKCVSSVFQVCFKRGTRCHLSHKASNRARANDSCGVRTHALADWRLKPAP